MCLRLLRSCKIRQFDGTEGGKREKERKMAEIRRIGDQRPITELISPEMKRKILLLRRKFDGCESRLDDLCHVLEEVRNGLNFGGECVECLLTKNPYEAWEARRIKEEEKEEWLAEDLGETDEERNLRIARRRPPAEPVRTFTPEMRRDIDDLRKHLEEYADCLGQAFDDVVKLDSLNTAVGIAAEIRCVDQLENPKRQRRRPAEFAREDEEDPLAGL